MIDSPAFEIGNSRDFAEVRTQVHGLVRAISPRHDLAPIDQTFALTELASQGRLIGYSSLLTPYHDQGHVLEVVLCSARLLHGLHLAGKPVDRLCIDAALIGALLHDSGYLMAQHEQAGTGAQFTQIHVARGVMFAEVRLHGVLTPDLLGAVTRVILATDHRPIAVMPEFENPSEQLAAWVTATADLVGQMSNREYLERLLLLYFEFREAGISFFSDVHDLLEKTGSFYTLMNGRLQRELGNLTPYLTQHFDQARGVKRNFYAESLERNLDFLATIVSQDRATRFERLKRGGIVDRAIQLLDE